MPPRQPVRHTVLSEGRQRPETRVKLLKKIAGMFDMDVVCYFTSFIHPVMIDDEDADLLDDILRQAQLARRLLLLISSPGGDALAAERIINICRAHSPDGKYEVIVPMRAKSAATMICMGAEHIHMSQTSELGPVDPQHVIFKNGEPQEIVSVHSIVESYHELLKQAVTCEGNVHVYIELLANYNPAEIKKLEAALQLTGDIAAKAVQKASRPNDSVETICEDLEIFLDPKHSRAHGRLIDREQAKQAGLPVVEHDVRSEKWDAVAELYVRASQYVNTHAAKAIETVDTAFSA